MRMTRVLAVAAVVWVLVDVVRVWAPSLITLVGQAASTPPELMGAYALGCVGVAVVPLLLVRRGVVSVPTAVLALVLIAAVCRGVLQAIDGGLPQVAASSLGVAAAVAALCLVAAVLAEAVVPGLLGGITAAAVSHAFLGTYGAIWREDVWAVVWLVVQLAALAVGLRTTLRAARDRQSPRAVLPNALGMVVLPALLLAGVTVGNPARALVAGELLGPPLLGLAAVAAVLCALHVRTGRVLTAIAGAVLTGAVALVLLPAQTSTWSLLAHLTGLPALAVVLTGLRPRRALPPGRELRPGSSAVGSLAVFGGAVAWVVLLFVYYAGYDLGYRADLVLVVLAVLLGLLGVLGARPGRERVRPLRAPVWAGAAALAVLAPFGAAATLQPVPWTAEEHEGLRILAYNVRMGYGMDGTFDARGVAELIAAEDPDVVLLSEVDRAWLLNGGQDQLTILSRLLDLPAHFGPAADPVWGDAILTDLPARWGEPVPLPSFGAVTGAQALPAHVAFGGQEWTVVSTHIQPHPGPGDGSLAQAEVLADLVGEQPAPVVLGGDLNLEPGDPSWEVLLAAGLTDALADARPLPTSPADAPDIQIDHVLVSPEMTGSDAHAVPSELSDHLAVVVTLLPAD